MQFDIELIRAVYGSFSEKVKRARAAKGAPLTLAEKILYAHLFDPSSARPFRRGEDYVDFRPDRVAMQDATAQMALLQFMNAGRDRSAVPASVHCDHLILADRGASDDLRAANESNREVYDFLRSVANRYGLGFWRPGAGIIHQVVLENYAFPGGMMIGTDSHTPNAGGLGMIAIGVGGADAVDVMAGMPWELKMPKIIGVRLSGKLSGWASPKDVILKLAGLLTVKGGTNAVIEYFGEGTASLSATGKATICNMGAEVGATTSLFPYDEAMARYLRATGREEVASLADRIASDLIPDAETAADAAKYYDRVIDIDLSALEPHINGPFTPDAAHTISDFGAVVREKGYPRQMEVGLIGSCTNSSYQDLSRAASVARQAKAKGLKAKAKLIINPGSEQVRQTAERDGLLDDLLAIGGTVMTNACGPCIGQWDRHAEDNERPNSIVTSFNRNFAKRADGNPNTHAFVASPELVVALTIAGDLTFNPLRDELINESGRPVRLDEPPGRRTACGRVRSERQRLCRARPVAGDGSRHSARLAAPAAPRPVRPLGRPGARRATPADSGLGQMHDGPHLDGRPWLRFRGHLENISDNLLMGAVNRFNGRTNSVLNTLDGSYASVSSVAKGYKEQGIGSIVVAEENYGEGSSREHAALEPRFLNVRAVLVKSFARIHETNLKKQGMLALTFVDPSDYDRIREDDRISITGLRSFAPGSRMTVTLLHSDGTSESFEAAHTYNEQQIGWFKAGSALNVKA